ncbi:adenylate/guanylate cyclase domain-containing protein [Cupriavidus sp. D384]|uniref:adenylate/guanylate cyclase domain-containing protein n=1 Tax=Cupriavidus sp. D384 TaxID=1538095 RepID=UPI000B2CEBF8|nr:adenylate/guanylate cyclase domain-containing protein [Cupriavidus sp. D384]
MDQAGVDQQAPGDASLGSVMFADVSGSTRLYELAGDAAALAAIGRCMRVMTSCAGAWQGQVIKTIGDELMVMFPSADKALLAAIDMQLAVSELAPVAGVAMSVHIGLHHGPLLREASGDVFGDTVNLAARLTTLASRGQVITSKETVGHLSASVQQRTRSLYPIRVRGRDQPVELFEAIWQEGTDLTLVAEPSQRAVAYGFLTLRYRETLVEMTAESAPVTLGRDGSMTIVVADRRASRFQAVVEPRAGRYVLVDRSSNGTHVSVDGEAPFVLRRDEIALRRHGWLTFGEAAGPSDERVEFFLQTDQG